MSAMLENVIKRFEQYDEMSPQELLDEQVRPLPRCRNAPIAPIAPTLLRANAPTRQCVNAPTPQSANVPTPQCAHAPMTQCP